MFKKILNKKSELN